MRVTASRRDGGKPLRDAMKEAGYNRITLAARTKEVDADSIGVSQQLIAFVSTDKDWARETTSVRTAILIAAALGKPEGDLFVMPDSFVSTVSTHS